MRVLIVDDDICLLRSLAAVLEEWGASVDFVTDAQKAAELVCDGTYTFVLLDLKMPVRSGLWFMKNARIPPGTKVILMSGYAPDRILREMEALGICDYIEKPFGIEDLMGVLEKHSTASASAAHNGQPGDGEPNTVPPWLLTPSHA